MSKYRFRNDRCFGCRTRKRSKKRQGYLYCRPCQVRRNEEEAFLWALRGTPAHPDIETPITFEQPT